MSKKIIALLIIAAMSVPYAVSAAKPNAERGSEPNSGHHQREPKPAPNSPASVLSTSDSSSSESGSSDSTSSGDTASDSTSSGDTASDSTSDSSASTDADNSSKPEKPEKPQKPSNHEKPQKPVADNTPEIDGDTTVSPRPEKPQKPEKPTETLDPNASPRPEKPQKPEKPDATIDPSATADPDAEPSDEVADEEKSEISKDEFKKKKEERRNAHIEAKEYIKELKPLFKDADSETRKEILSEIAEAKKDLQEYSIGVFVRGIDLDFGKYNNVTPYIKNDLTLIPLRAVAESLDADVSWDDETRTITITKNDTTIVMQVDSQTALINGEEYELAAVPEINNGRTMVPLRFIMEAMKSTVEWDDESRTVIIE